jgi:hypothetical protein
MEQATTTRTKGPSLAALLLAGDLIALLIFATIGRMSHERGLSLPGVLGTAAPFVIGWLLVAPLTGIYRAQPRPTPGAMARRSALNWALALPIAFGLRALIEQRGIPLSFAVVAGSFTFVTLVGWRSALALLLGSQRAPS